MTYTTKNWMSQLPDSQKLIQTFIPGTHDSSSYLSDDGMGPAADAAGAITQGGNYASQLANGIRYFDVRCVDDGGVIYLHHNMYNGEKFEDVLTNQIISFLNDNPSEIVFLDIDIKDNCEYGVYQTITGALVQNMNWLATECVNPNGSFNTTVTWGDLRKNNRRIVVTWSSRMLTPQRDNQLFGNWSGVHVTPNMIEWNNTLLMYLLDHNGAIYVASSQDGIRWQSKAAVEKQRLFYSWSGAVSTPSVAIFNGKIYMCLTDSNGAIYIASSPDGINWPSQEQVLSQRLFGNWDKVKCTPTLVSFNNNLVMCLLDSKGAIYVASSSDGATWPSEEEVKTKQLFGDWSGVGSTPTLVEFNQSLIMCLLDNPGSIFVASSNDGVTWPDKATVEAQRLFKDWSGVASTPTMIPYENQLFMCLLGNPGDIYTAFSSDGINWPSKSDVEYNRLYGDWAGIHSTPTYVNFITGDQRGILCMCRVSHDGGIYTASSSSGIIWYIDSNPDDVVAWLSFNNQFRWDPYDDFDVHMIDTILDYLTGYLSKWKNDRMFVAQVVDTPTVSPFQSPNTLENLYGDKMNAWVTALTKQSNANIILRDFVDRYPDMINHIISLNFN